jgi:hypothetical protein
VAPVVPRSLTEPVPASQARSQIQELLDSNRARVERLSRAGQRALVQQLAALEAELRERLEKLQRSGRGESWTAADTEATLVQVRELLGRQGAAFRALLRENAATARRLGVRNTVAVLQHFEGKTGAPIRPLALEASTAAQQPLLARHEDSVARYGLRAVGRISQAIQRGLLAGDSFSEMQERLVGKRGGHGVLVECAGDASRIVRTEAMHAYNAGAHEEALAQRAERFPDLQKKLIETFDARTGADSRAAHGEVRALEAMFVDGKGRHYMHPPGRPNDRGVEIPWRAAWAGASQSPAETARGMAQGTIPSSDAPRTDFSTSSSSGGQPPPGARTNTKPEPVGTIDPQARHTELTVGVHCTTLRSELSDKDTKAILSVLKEANLLAFLEKHRIETIVLQKDIIETDVPTPTGGVLKVRSDGKYTWAHPHYPEHPTLRLRGGKREPIELNWPWQPTPGHWTTWAAQRPPAWDATGAGKIAAARKTLIHEFGHHIIAIGNNNDQFRGPITDILKKHYASASKNFLTKYSEQNMHEYFCESFSLYVYARNDLRYADPVGFQMVEEVLRHASIGLLPPLP